MKLFTTILITFFALVNIAGQRWQSDIVPIIDGKLTYVSDENQNRIPDYSYAGYKNGNDTIPDVPVAVTLSPSEGDRTADIQAAIDQIEAMTPDSEGLRGAVYLEAGKYLLEGVIVIDQSGVVLRGAGDGYNPASNTIIYRDNPNNSNNVITMGSGNGWRAGGGDSFDVKSNITSAFVQVGSRQFDIEHPELFSVGDHIVVLHPDSEAWLQAVNYGGTGTHEDAKPWAPGETDVQYNRYITAINGNTITIDAPVFMHLDKSLSQSFIYKLNEAEKWATQKTGLENFRIDIATNGPETEGQAMDLIKMKGAENFWIKSVTGMHFWRSFMVFHASLRGTITDCKGIEPHGILDKGIRRYIYFPADEAQLLLFRENFSEEGKSDYTCGGSGVFASANSGNVFHNNIIYRSHESVDNHVRWYTGNCFDRLQWLDYVNNPFEFSSSALDIANRGNWSGQAGYTSAHCMAWNCYAPGARRFNVQGVPSAQNYAIGCIADTVMNFKIRDFFVNAPEAYYEGTNTPGVFPYSIYMAQLRQRLDTTTVLNMESPTDIPVEEIHIFNGEHDLSIGYKDSLFSAIFPADASNTSILWSSSDPSVLTVEDGVISGISEGVAFVKATDADGNVSDSTEIKVVNYVFLQGVEISPSLLVMTEGDTDTLGVVFSPDTASNKTVSWSSDDPSVVSVADGVITAEAPGNTHIRIKSEEGDFSASSFIIVNQGVNVVDERQNQDYCLVYPNPANNILYVENLPGCRSVVNIYNFMGQLVFQSMIEGESALLNIRELQKGNYFINIPNVKTKYKFIKE